MDDVIDYRELVRLVEAGIEGTWRQILASCPSERVIGYALCTDDEVQSVYDAACSESIRPAYRFSPVEWMLGAKRDDLLRASEFLERRARLDVDRDRHTQCDRAFEALVEGLANVRARGLFGEEVYLSVLSTDPSLEMVHRWHASVLRLNSPAMVRQWRQARLCEAEDVLASYATRSNKSWGMLDHEERLRVEIATLRQELEDD